MVDVFPSAKDAIMLPLQVTGTLLLAFLPQGSGVFRSCPDLCGM